MTFPFGQPITLITRTVTGTDALGNDITTAAASVVQGAFAPGSSSETSNSDDQVITDPTVYLPSGTDLAAVDAVQVGGVEYEVQGDPAMWGPNPLTGSTLGGIVAILRRVSG